MLIYGEENYCPGNKVISTSLKCKFNKVYVKQLYLLKQRKASIQYSVIWTRGCNPMNTYFTTNSTAE